MEQVYDRLPSGTLDDFDEFRNKAYPYTYLCKSCTRSFDSVEERKSCKFCQGHIVLLRRTEMVPKGLLKRKSPKYFYVCSTCGNEFATDEPVNNCHFCRTKWLHVYSWDDLGKVDKFSIKFMGALKNLVSKKEKHRTRIHRALRENNAGAVSETNGNQANFNRNRTKKPARSFSFSNPLSRRPKEELPTY